MPFYRRRTGYRRRYGSSYRRPSIAAQVGRAIRRATYNSDMADKRAAIAGTRRYRTIKWPVGSTAASIKGVFGDPDAGLTPEQQAMREITGFRGKGGYWGRMIGRALGGDRGARWGDRLGDMAAGAIRSYVPGGGAAMSAIDMLGSAHRAFTGQGEYTSNALVNGGVDGIPSFAPASDGGILMTNKEYICDIFAPQIAGTFNVSTFPINPGLEKTFPWLCQIAENFDEYTLEQCIFTYKSTVADFASASGQVGQVIMATQYNAAQAPFADKQTMMQYAGAISGKTSQDILQGVECDPTKLSGPDGRFVRNGPVPAGYFGDLNNYDHGNLNIAVIDTPSTYLGQQMGELWVSYTVRLNKPKFVTSNGWGISRDVFVSKAAGTILVPFGIQSAPTWLSGQQNSIGGKVLLPASSGQTLAAAAIGIQAQLAGATVAATDPLSFVYVFPQSYTGNVRIMLTVTLGSANPAAWGVVSTTGSNITVINDLYGGSDAPRGSIAATNAAAGAFSIFIMDIRVNSSTSGFPSALVFCNQSGGFATTDNAMLDISEYNTIFNYKQDGSNDAIVLLNPAGTVA